MGGLAGAATTGGEYCKGVLAGTGGGFSSNSVANRPVMPTTTAEQATAAAHKTEFVPAPNWPFLDFAVRSPTTAKILAPVWPVCEAIPTAEWSASEVMLCNSASSRSLSSSASVLHFRPAARSSPFSLALHCVAVSGAPCPVLVSLGAIAELRNQPLLAQKRRASSGVGRLVPLE